MAVETKAEVVEESSSPTSSDLEALADKDEGIAKAITRLKDAGEEVTKYAISEELFGLFDLGHLNLDEYDQAKKVLGL